MATSKQTSWQDPGVIIVAAIDPHGTEAIRGRLQAQFAAVSKVIKGVPANDILWLTTEQDFFTGLERVLGNAQNAFERAAQQKRLSLTPVVLAAIAAEFESSAEANVTAFVDEWIHIPDDAKRAEFNRLLQAALIVK